MGKIHDRLKAHSQRLHTIVVDARVKQALEGVTAGRAADTARRLSVFMQNLDYVRADRSFDASGRHFAMQRMAEEAKKLGLKGRWNLLCNRTQCLRDSAVYYNRGSYAFYCIACASELNRVNRRDAEDLLGEGQKLCVPVATQEEAAKLHVMP